MKASKVLRTSLVWLPALGVTLSLSSALWGAGELDNVRFALDRIPAAWGQSEVTLHFSMRDVPPGAEILGFGFSFGFHSRDLAFHDASVGLSCRYHLYVLDNAREGDMARVRLEVFFSRPTAIADGELLSLTFVPELTQAEDFDMASLLLPVWLIPGDETWIYLEGYDPLFPVRHLEDGGVDLWGSDALHFGSVAAPRASAVVMPIMLTNVSALASLSVGVDYDEDMLEVLAWEPAPDIADRVTGFAAVDDGDLLTLNLTFSRELSETAAARRPVAYVTFWLKAGAVPGADISLGDRTFAEGTVEDPSGNHRVFALSAIEGGRITAEDNFAYFLRGDVNADRVLDASDPIALLVYLFGARPPAGAPCPDAADANDDGAVDLADALRLLSYAFRNGQPPRPPFPNLDLDPTYDELAQCERRR